MNKILFAALLSAFVFSAEATVISYDKTETKYADAITGFATESKDMNGMKLTACFIDLSCETLLWSDGAKTKAWSLVLSGDSFSELWTLKVDKGYKLFSLTLDGSLSKTVFDTVNDQIKTPNSAIGYLFKAQGKKKDLSVTFSDQVAVNGKVYGDLWSKMSLTWSKGHTGLMSFRQDTDNATSEIKSVSAPNAGILMGLGLMLIAAAKRRKAK